MTLRRSAYILILVLLMTAPILAQENSKRFLAYEDVVADIFPGNTDDSHDWQLQADVRDIVELQVRRIGGVFTPRIELIAPDGSIVLAIIDEADNYSQTLIFQNGLPLAGNYQIRVSQQNASSDGLLTQSEYSLTVMNHGQVIADDTSAVPIPASITQIMPDYFSGEADTLSFPGIEIFGEVTVNEPDPLNFRNRFLMIGTRSIRINDTNVVSRVLERIAFLDEGLALQSNSGAVLYTGANISNLALESQILTVALDNGKTITTDFYDIDLIIVEEELVAARLLDGQVLIFDGSDIQLTRRGGILGEGPNAEPILVIHADGNEIQTDVSGWHTLSLENDILTLVYPGGWQIQSDELSAGLLQRGNSFRPDLNSSDTDTSLFDIQFDYTDEDSLRFTIDPQGLRGVQISDETVSLDFLDNRHVVDQLADLSVIEISNQLARLNKIDGTVATILRDGTRISTPSEIPVNTVALPYEEGFRPQNFNNTGTTISDYHPRVDMDFALLPVNQVTGNFVYPVQDYFVPGPALPLEWSRTYNSLVAESQTPQYMRDNARMSANMGHYWRHHYQIELDVQFAPAGEVHLILADGSSHIFNNIDSDNHIYRSDSLLSWTIQLEGDFSGDWTAYRADGIQYHFDTAGRLQRIADIQGHVLLFSSIPQQYLTAFNAEGGFFVTGTYGRRLEVYTNTSGHVSTVREVQGRTIHYSYDADELIAVDYPGEEYGANYTYEDARLSTIDDVNSPYAQQMSLDYNSAGQVTHYSYYPDDDLSESYDLRYEDNRTVLSWRVTGNDNRNDNRNIILEYDANYRITSRTMPDEDWVYQWRYSQETGLLSEIVQATLAVLRFNYDQSGYLTRFTDPLFGSATGFYGFTYESGEQFTRRLLQVDAPDVQAWQTLTYDSINRLQERNQFVSGTGDNRQFYTTRYVYNTDGELHQILETAASDGLLITEFEYDDFGYPRRISLQSNTDAVPLKHWQLVHDGAGRLLRILDSDDNRSTLQWDNDRNLLLNLIIGDEVYHYEYDNRDNLSAQIAPGIMETYTYDESNRLIAYNDARQEATRYQYDSAGNLIALTLPDNSRTNYRYDGLDNLIASVAEDGFETRYAVSFNQESNRTLHTVTNPQDEQTQYQFDPLGRLRQVSDFDREGNLTFQYVLTYNARGNLTEISDSRGRSLNLSYDSAGNPLITSINNNASTRYLYNDAGLLERVTNPTGESINYLYNISGSPVRVFLPDGSEQRYAYDAVGNLSRFVNPVRAETTYNYDSSHRLISETNPLNAITAYSYDEAGNLSTITDARPDTPPTQFTYDELNQLVALINPVEGITRYQYDEIGNLIRVIEPGGLQTTFTYDFSNNVVALSQPDDREFLYGRDSVGRIISETNPSGQTSIFSYNVIGKIGRITNPQGSGQFFGWFGNGRLTRYEVSNGAEYEYISDATGRLVEIVDLGIEEAQAVNTRIEYDANGRITTIRQGNRLLIESDNAIIHDYVYDELGRVIRYRPPESIASYIFEYDATGNLISQTNPDGIERQYFYDLAGNITEIVSASNTDNPIRERYEYDAVNNLIRALTADGIERHYSYDAANRLIQLTEITADAENNYLFAYDAAGRITRYLAPGGLETLYRYDLFGNPVAIEQRRTLDAEELTQTTRYQYDALDNLVSVEMPGGQTTRLSYNGSGQRVRYVDASDNSWSFSYDSTGNIAQISNPLGNNERYDFDISNRLAQINFATGAILNFSYDGLGNLNHILLPETASTSSREHVDYEFDTLANLINITHAVDNTTGLERDNSGRVVAIHTASGATIELGYDAFGRIASIDANARTIIRSYDNAGRLVEIADADDIYRIRYDASGNISTFDLLEESIIEETEIVESSIHYTYDSAGNILERNAGAYGTIRYDYDAFNRPITIEINEHRLEIDYNANGWRSLVRRSNGVETRYSYDGNGRVRNIAHIGADSQRLDGFAYDYDAVGNIIRVTRGDNRAILYSYDVTQQLLTERWLDESNHIIYSVNYTYDAAGNRIEQTTQFEGENQSRTLFEYNNRNQIVSETRDVAIDIEDRFALPVSIAVIFTIPLLFFARRRPRWIVVILLSLPLQVLAWQTEQDASVIYEYDVNGNLLHEIYPAEEQINYSYDDFNRLLSVESVNLTGETLSLTTIRYNVIGRIAEVTENENAYEFFYDINGLIAVRNMTSGSVQNYFAPAPGETLLMTTDDAVFWTIDDGFGQLSRFANAEGNTVGARTSFSRNAFHEIIDSESESDTSIPQTDFVEQFYLSDSDIILMGVRAYHPRIGRFLQRDPVRHDPRGNLYTYAYNSPTNFIDPTGMTAESAFKGFDPDIPIIDPTQFIQQATQPDVPVVPDVEQLQSDENYRILELAYMAEFIVNDSAFYLTASACDVYLRVLHPVDEASQLQSGANRRTMLDLYDTDNSWLPSSRPEPGASPIAMNELMTINRLLSRSLQGATVLEDCPDSFNLPVVSLTPPTAFYDELSDMRSLLNEVSLYPAFANGISIAPTIPTAETILPYIQTDSLNPTILPELPGQIGDLHEDTASLFGDILLPSIGERPFEWQVLNQAQNIAPVAMIHVND